MLDRIEFLITEALTSLRRNPWMSFAAITTSAMALLLLGGLGLAYLSVQRYADTLPSQLDMRVFLELGLPQERVDEIALEIREIPQVENVDLITKEEAWEQMQARFPDLTEGFDNVMTDSYRVTLKELGDFDSVAARIKEIPGHDNVAYLSEEYNLINEVISLIKLIGLVLGGMMLLTSGVLIYNAIRLAILARSREIRIMQLVGATRSTIWIPLMLEGAVQGALGGVIAASILWPAYGLVQSLIKNIAFLKEQESAFPVGSAYGILVLAGVLYGLICSLIAVRQPGKER